MSENKPITVLPQEEIEAIKNIVSYEVRQQITYSGPLPTASEFKGYEDTLQGAADRILTLAEKEQQSRFETQELLISKQFILNLLGQIFAGILGLCFVALAVLLVLRDQPTSAVAVLALVAGVIAAFLHGRHKEAKQEDNDSPN